MDRARVLAHRWWTQGLDRSRTGVPAARSPVLDLGVVDVPTPAARTALAIRGALPPGDDVALVWGARGAPALHRRADLQSVADALWPSSDEDATRRIRNPRIPAGADLGLAAFRAVAEAVHDVLAGAGRQVTKAELSAGVTERVPRELTFDCAPCGSRHVSGSVLQDAGLAGGAELVRVGRGTEFRLLPGLRVPGCRSGFEDLVAAYLRLLGPAEPSVVAAYFAVAVGEVASAWPGQPPVPVDRPAARGVRLLPPGDPWLQARDRAFTVPREFHPRVWKAIGAPGALLVDGEVLGTWRAAAARGRLGVTVDGFADLPARVGAALEEEIAVVAAARGLSA
ncbi:DNA glycosylase AlkZ-like family protein [Kineococcus sp. SYSU DK001]|uniref:DNA glycosylase AlkZ-like family protein n=1 Tax=Kineococcus sp. SYSU DK001 TaxID=3383122 RepID=UPI003D7D99FE